MIVVDNASSDRSVEMVRREFPLVTLMVSPENLGFTRANNRAIERASGEYVLLLNPDTTILGTHTVMGWLSFMDKHQDAGASGCKLVFPDGTHQVGDAGFRPTLASVASYALFLSRISPFFKGVYLNYHRLDAPCEVDWVCGADLLVRRSIIVDTGLMDEDIFMYADDVEWGCRIRSSGCKIYYLPISKIIHSRAQRRATKEGTPSFAWFENMRHLYGLYHKGQPIMLFDILFSINFLLRGVLYHLCYLKSKDPGTGAKAGSHVAVPEAGRRTCLQERVAASSGGYGEEMRIGIDFHAAEREGTGNCTYIRNIVEQIVRLAPEHEYFLYVTDAPEPLLRKIPGKGTGAS